MQLSRFDGDRGVGVGSLQLSDPEMGVRSVVETPDQMVRREFDEIVAKSLKGMTLSPHRQVLLRELSVEVVRVAGVAFLASLVFFRMPKESDSQSGQEQMATAFLIGPLFTALITESVFNIGRKVSLMCCPVLVTPGIKRAAEYRRQFEENRRFFSPSMCEFLELSISRYTNILENYRFDVKELATAIEEVLRLPLKPKRLTAENEKVRDLLRDYPRNVREQVARFVAEVCRHSQEEIPSKRITPIVLVGPPGTGKTFLVRQLSEALKLPICEVKIGSSKSILGNNMWSMDPAMGVVLDALLKSSLDSPESPPANVILFIDEPDKVLEKGKDKSFTHPSGNDVFTFLHTLLESGTTEMPFPRYFNAVHPIRHLIVVIGVNRRFSEVVGEEAALALESRVRTIDFGEGFDRRSKEAVVAKFLATHPKGPQVSDSIIQRIIEKDESCQFKGVRILLDVIHEYLQSISNKDEIAYLLGSSPSPFDVDAAYKKYLPKPKKEVPSSVSAAAGPA